MMTITFSEDSCLFSDLKKLLSYCNRSVSFGKVLNRIIDFHTLGLEVIFPQTLFSVSLGLEICKNDPGTSSPQGLGPITTRSKEALICRYRPPWITSVRKVASKLSLQNGHPTLLPHKPQSLLPNNLITVFLPPEFVFWLESLQKSRLRCHAGSSVRLDRSDRSPLLFSPAPLPKYCCFSVIVFIY